MVTQEVRGAKTVKHTGLGIPADYRQALLKVDRRTKTITVFLDTPDNKEPLKGSWPVPNTVALPWLEIKGYPDRIPPLRVGENVCIQYHDKAKEAE